MAKQAGPVLFTGTIDGIIFYKVGDKYYSRSKGSYKSAKHMRRNPRYKRTMENADQFGGASKLVQEIYYRHVPKQHRKQGVYGQLTGLVNGWLHEGKSREEAQALLIAHCQTLSAPIDQRTTINEQRKPAQPKAAQPKVEQRPTNNDQRPKQTRYLSHWKVKPNGKLHIPFILTTNQTQSKKGQMKKTTSMGRHVIPLIPIESIKSAVPRHAELVSASDPASKEGKLSKINTKHSDNHPVHPS
jgi:hypothetical protein